MQQERIKFFTQELTLSEEESIALGKVLLELDERKIELRNEIHVLVEELRKKKNPSNNDLIAYIKLRCENDIKIAKIEEEKLLELSKILPPEKVLRIDETKRKFFDQFTSFTFQNKVQQYYKP